MATEASSESRPSDSLLDRLKSALPQGFTCRVRYMRTQPKRCDPLFSPAPGRDPEKTWLSSHFLVVSIDTQPSGAQSESSNNQSQSRERSDVAVLALEVLVYKTKHLTTIFISKADSTGYLPVRRPSPVKTISATFLQWLATQERRRNPARKLVISLFARAQSQYLFPGSAENSGKHVLNDRQLIKWWTRVLDPIFDSKDPSLDVQSLECQGYITVPGYQGQSELRQFFPPSYTTSGSAQHWKAGHPLYELARERSVSEAAPTRCLLPRFPDDPKARFIQDLDDEVGLSAEADTTASPSKRRNGQWSSIRNLDRFWEGMEFRQECSSGRVVGFLWLVIGEKRNESEAVSSNGHAQNKQASDLVGPAASQESTLSSEPIQPTADEANTKSSPAKRRRKHLTGPIIPRQPRLKGGSSNLSTSSSLNGLVDEEGLAELVLSNEGYTKAMHTLLHLDFANREVAVQSTSKWVAEASSISGIQKGWSSEVIGTAKVDAGNAQSSSNGQMQPVNDLGSMVKKKRKAEDPAAEPASASAIEHAASAVEKQPAANMLGAGLVRKKPKPATS